MFSYITMNWRGRPLISYRVIIQLTANTTTKKGLKINAQLDQGYYPTRPGSRSPTSPCARDRSTNFRAGPKEPRVNNLRGWWCRG